jgi:hypothetical protein
LKHLSHAGSAATSSARLPVSVLPPRHLPWDGVSHPLVWRLPAETISRADVGEVSLMSAHVGTLPQHPTGVWMLWRHRPREGVSSHTKQTPQPLRRPLSYLARYPRDSRAHHHRACRQLTSIRVTFACLYETPSSKYKERLAAPHGPGKAKNSSGAAQVP